MRRILWQRISRSLFFRSYLSTPRQLYFSLVLIFPLPPSTHSQASYLRALFSPRENADRRFCYFISPFIAPLDFLPFILLPFSLCLSCEDAMSREVSHSTRPNLNSHIRRDRYLSFEISWRISAQYFSRTPHIFCTLSLRSRLFEPTADRTFSIPIANCRSMSSDRSRYIFVATKHHLRIDN